jgi:acyl dehydratase
VVDDERLHKGGERKLPMRLTSDFAGSSLKDYETLVTWRRTMNYAASVGDNNSFYFDDERAGGVVAPPMFSVAVTWPVCERIWEYIQADGFPTEILVNLVHYSECLTFHRLAVPGDHLTVKGSIAAITPHRAGTLIVLRLQALDEQSKPVFTEHIGGLLRGVECLGEAKTTEPLPIIPKHGTVGPPLWESAMFIDRMASFVYDGCTDIFFPIHTSVGFAHRVGLPGIVLQGTATLAYAVRDLLDREAGSDPSLLGAVACRFTGMVVPGSELRVILRGRTVDEARKELFFNVLNGDGDAVLSDGYARIERNLEHEKTKSVMS